MKLFDGLKNWSSFQRQGAAILISLFMVCAHYSCEARTHEFKIIKTTCEYLLNPTLVATTTPRFGWQIQTGKESQGTLQSAYTIEIYDQSGGKEVKIWDSGKVASTESQRTPYNGAEELIPGMEYTWRVKVWDSHDVPSPWSEYATFRIAPTDLAATAKWIGAIDIKDANIPEGRSYHGLSISSEAGQRWQQTHIFTL